MSRSLLLLLSCSLVLWGCQAAPNLKKLQDENGALQQQLDKTAGRVNSLEAEKALLKQDVAELNRVVGVLGQEKSSRVEESTSLRGEARQFAQFQIDNLKKFLLESNLVDYIGGELVERSSTDKEPLLLVDMANRVPLNGTLTGVGGYFQSPGALSVRLLRPVGDNLVVLWASQSVTVAERGLQRLEFPVSVGVEKGDYLAYYLSQPGMVTFDTGTGDGRYLDEDVAVGTLLKASSLKGENDKRAYSIGVFGLLNTR